MPPQDAPVHKAIEIALDRDRGCSFRPFVFLPTLATAKDARMTENTSIKQGFLGQQTLCRGSATLQSEPPSSHESSIKITGSRRGLSLLSGLWVESYPSDNSTNLPNTLGKTLCIGRPSLLCDLPSGGQGFLDLSVHSPASHQRGKSNSPVRGLLAAGCV